MSAELHVEKLVLQGDLYAENFTIHDLDLTGLGLTKSSVGLGNVDNTSDVLKPLSNATIAALALKEPAIAAGTHSQFWAGDKTWVNYGALALQNGATTLPLISVRGAAASSNATLACQRNDTNAQAYLEQIGASVFGNILTGLPAANVGALVFENDAFGVIKTNNSAPIIFGTNSLIRARLGLGLFVGASSSAEPGAGCIQASGTITGAILAGVGSGITGLTKDQIPATLNATVMPRLDITGVGGAGYISFAGQSSNPSISGCQIFGNALGRISIRGTINAFNISFANDLLTANRIWIAADATGTIPVIVSAPASAGASGKTNSIAFDATHIYVCIATNTWVRATLATF